MVVMRTFSSLVTPALVLMSTAGTTRDNKFVDDSYISLSHILRCEELMKSCCGYKMIIRSKRLVPNVTKFSKCRNKVVNIRAFSSWSSIHGSSSSVLTHWGQDKMRFLNENVWILLKISLKFVPKGPINNIPALVQIMAWRRPDDKPLSEAMLVSLLMHKCVTWPPWVDQRGLHKSQGYCKSPPLC